MTSWEDWRKRKALAESVLARYGSRALATLYGRYGKGPPRRLCAACQHAKRVDRDTIYYKCEVAGETHGAATDWRLYWPACGKFEEERDDEGVNAATTLGNAGRHRGKANRDSLVVHHVPRPVGDPREQDVSDFGARTL